MLDHVSLREAVGFAFIVAAYIAALRAFPVADMSDGS